MLTYLMTDSRFKINSRADRASPCLTPLLILKESNNFSLLSLLSPPVSFPLSLLVLEVFLGVLAGLAFLFDLQYQMPVCCIHIDYVYQCYIRNIFKHLSHSKDMVQVVDLPLLNLAWYSPEYFRHMRLFCYVCLNVLTCRVKNQ